MNRFSFTLGEGISWDSRFSLGTRIAGSEEGDSSDIRKIFGGFILHPPTNISVSHTYVDGDITAMVTWVNTIEEEFAGLETVLTILTEDGRVRRSEDRTTILDYDITGANYSSSAIPWGSRLVLQAAVWDIRGEESDPINIFSNIDLDPPRDIFVTHEVVDDNLTAVISWDNQNDFQDMKGPAILLKFWHNTEGEPLKLIEEIEIPYYGQTE